MKPSKYAMARKSDEPAPKPATSCDRCGWSFVEEHWTPMPEKGKGRRRREERTQIAIPHGAGFVTRCDECYESELWRSGKHRYSSMTQEDMDALGKNAVHLARCMPQLSKFLREPEKEAA